MAWPGSKAPYIVSLVNDIVIDIQIMIAAFPAPVTEGIRKDRQLSAK